jgi:hypothetical protein
MVRPSAFAVLRLITNSGLVDRMTGRSAFAAGVENQQPLSRVRHRNPSDGINLTRRGREVLMAT